MPNNYNVLPNGPDERWHQIANTLQDNSRYVTHQAFFEQEYPMQVSRGAYNPAYAPAFEQLTVELPTNIDHALSQAESKDALVIVGSGYSLLNALARNVGHIDGIDNNPNQIGWAYGLHSFIALTAKADVLSALASLRQTHYTYRVLDSMAMPPIRQQYLDRLPEVFSHLQVPERYQPSATQAITHGSFRFHKEMMQVPLGEGTTLWDRFMENYDQIRARIISGDGIRLNEADVMQWTTRYPGSYDVIYSSNVYDHVSSAYDLAAYTARLTQGLRTRGISTIASLFEDVTPPPQIINDNHLQLVYDQQGIGPFQSATHIEVQKL